MRWMGALMLVGGCSTMGLRRSRELRRRVRQLQQMLGKLERLYTEVCHLGTALPELLPILTGVPVRMAELRDISFEALWSREIQRISLWTEERRVVEELGRALSRGDEPERAFSAAKLRLGQLLALAQTEADSQCRLSEAMGICSGLLLAIVLI